MSSVWDTLSFKYSMKIPTKDVKQQLAISLNLRREIGAGNRILICYLKHVYEIELPTARLYIEKKYLFLAIWKARDS